MRRGITIKIKIKIKIRIRRNTLEHEPTEAPLAPLKLSPNAHQLTS